MDNPRAAKLLLDELKTLPPEVIPTHVRITTRFV